MQFYAVQLWRKVAQTFEAFCSENCFNGEMLYGAVFSGAGAKVKKQKQVLRLQLTLPRQFPLRMTRIFKEVRRDTYFVYARSR